MGWQLPSPFLIGETMKFILDAKALAYLENKNIRQIFINPDLDQKSACCGIGTVDFIISIKNEDKEKYLNTNFNGIDIFYNPTLSMYIDEDSQVDISAFGFGAFKKLYIVNEFNSIER